ncbi:baseplate J/gp47 family protein [Komagataeibacter kakiaceti JCM 25156]
MTLSIPLPQTLFDRFCTALDGMTFTASDGTSVKLDARAPNTLENVLAAVHAMGLFGLYLTLQSLAKELMVTTATENGLLPQHAVMWGIPRNPATAAVGYVMATASVETIVPQGTEFTVDGTVRWITAQAVTVPAGSNGTPVPVVAETTGTAGNLAADITVTMVSPIDGITSVAVDSDGLAGGADIEDVEIWRSRIIDRIRNPASGGSEADYERWAKDAGAPYFNVVPDWVGSNTIGIIVAMPGPTVPTAAQLAMIKSYIDQERPVRGNIVVVAAEIVPQTPTISLNPDTANGRTLVQAAVSAYYAVQTIGGWLYKSQLSDAISSVSGETSHVISVPTGDQQMAPNQLASFDHIEWGNVV